MRQYIKYLGTAFVFFMIVIIGFSLALYYFFNPNDYKSQISHALSSQAHREIEIKGNIGWSLFPSLGLDVKEIQVNNAPEFDKTPFVEAARARISVKLLPLLHRHIEVDTLTLQGLKIHLKKNAQGKSNWQDLRIVAAPAANPPELKNAQPLVEKKLTFNVNISYFNISDATLVWDNAQNNQHIEIQHLQLQSKEFSDNHPFPLTMDFHIQGSQLALDADVHVDAKITTDLAHQRITIKPLDFKIASLTQKTKTNKITLDNVTLALNTVIHYGENVAASDKLSLSGNIKMDSLSSNNVHINNITSPIIVAGNVIHFDEIKGAFYQGTLSGSTIIDLRNKTPHFAVTETLSGVQIGPLLKDLKEITQVQLEGVDTLSSSLTAQGNDVDSLLRTLNGNVQFAIKNGVLHGIDVNYWLAVGTALYHREPMPDLKNTSETDFESLTGNMKITNGVAYNDDLLLQATFTRVTGKGSFNLVNQTLDYRLSAVKMNQQTHRPHEDVIPIRVTGSFSNPTIRPDVQELLKNEVKEGVKKLQEKASEAISKALGNDAGEKLKNLNLNDLFR